MTNVNITADRAMLMNTLSEILFKKLDGKELTKEDKVNYGIVFEKFQLQDLFEEFKADIREEGVNVATDLGYVDVTKPVSVTLDWQVFCKMQPESADMAMRRHIQEVKSEGLTFAQVKKFLSSEWKKEHGIRSTLDVTRDEYAKQVEKTAKVEFHPN